jgi:hypothetical protein
MRVKLDENIPVRLAGGLSPLGHDVDTVASEVLRVSLTATSGAPRSESSGS